MITTRKPIVDRIPIFTRMAPETIKIGPDTVMALPSAAPLPRNRKPHAASHSWPEEPRGDLDRSMIQRSDRRDDRE